MRLKTACPLFLLVLCACRGGLTPRVRIDPRLQVFIPPDTLALAGIRMDQLRATPVYHRLAEQNRLPRFDDFAGTGFDPKRDVRELLLANDGRNSLLIASGKFDVKVPGSVKASGYRGYTLYGNNENAVFAFIDKATAVAGPAPAVHAAIDRYRSGHGGAPAALLARAGDLPGAAQIWAVTSGWAGLRPETLRNMGNAANLDRVLRSVRDAALAADLRSGVHAAATGDCRTEQDARTLSESLRGLVGLGRLSVPDSQPEMLRVYDGIQVKQEGRSVKVNVDIPQDLTNQLLDRLR
jgi:hypothetical protein